MKRCPLIGRRTIIKLYCIDQWHVQCMWSMCIGCNVHRTIEYNKEWNKKISFYLVTMYESLTSTIKILSMDFYLSWFEFNNNIERVSKYSQIIKCSVMTFKRIFYWCSSAYHSLPDTIHCHAHTFIALLDIRYPDLITYATRKLFYVLFRKKKIGDSFSH